MVLVAFGLALLWSHAPVITLALILCGAGIGLESIAGATVPRSIFGVRDYAPIMDRLATPSLMAQAAAPTVGALLIQAFGIDVALLMVVVATIVNVGLGLVLLTMTTSFRVRPAEMKNETALGR